MSIQKTRKRKAARTVSSDDEATFSVDEDDNFESLISTQPFRSSSRRQIRPPKALCEDYYLGQQKVGCSVNSSLLWLTGSLSSSVKIVTLISGKSVKFCDEGYCLLFHYK